MRLAVVLAVLVVGCAGEAFQMIEIVHDNQATGAVSLRVSVGELGAPATSAFDLSTPSGERSSHDVRFDEGTTPLVSVEREGRTLAARALRADCGSTFHILTDAEGITTVEGQRC